MASKINWAYTEYVPKDNWTPLDKRVFSYFLNEYFLVPKENQSQPDWLEQHTKARNEPGQLRFELSRARTETAAASSKVTTKTKRLMSVNVNANNRMFDSATKQLVDAKLSLLSPHMVLVDLLLRDRPTDTSGPDAHPTTASAESQFAMVSAVICLAGMHDLSVEQTTSLIEIVLSADDTRARLHELPPNLCINQGSRRIM